LTKVTKVVIIVNVGDTEQSLMLDTGLRPIISSCLRKRNRGT